MYDDETCDFYLRGRDRKILKGRIDFEPYIHLYFLLYRHSELEPVIVEKALEFSRIQFSDVEDVIHDVILILAEEHDLEIPQYPQACKEEMRWQLAWNKVRAFDWKKQQGVRV